MIDVRVAPDVCRKSGALTYYQLIASGASDAAFAMYIRPQHVLERANNERRVPAQKRTYRLK